MAIPPETRARNQRILIRGGLFVALLAAALFLPGPGGALPVMLYESLLLAIFTLLTIGTTGPALRFVALSAFSVTVLLPVMVLTILSVSAEVGFVDALLRVWQALTEVNPLAGLYLLVPTMVTIVLAAVLAKRGYKLPSLKRR
jgi:hypothetical protein